MRRNRSASGPWHLRRFRARCFLLLVVPFLWGCGLGGALFKAIFLRSGAPPGDEIRRMEAREETMLRELPHRRILVLPVNVLNYEATPRPQAARMLAGMLRDAGYPGAEASTRSYPLPFPRQPNQAWLYWKRFRALADSIRASPPGGVDYILLLDIVAATRDDGTLRGIGGIHVMTVTGSGEMAYGRLRNSMHDIFQEFQPESMADASRLAVADLRAASGHRTSRPEG